MDQVLDPVEPTFKYGVLSVLGSMGKSHLSLGKPHVSKILTYIWKRVEPYYSNSSSNMYLFELIVFYRYLDTFTKCLGH